jgi:hypothetical protein
MVRRRYRENNLKLFREKIDVDRENRMKQRNTEQGKNGNIVSKKMAPIVMRQGPAEIHFLGNRA